MVAHAHLVLVFGEDYVVSYFHVVLFFGEDHVVTNTSISCLDLSLHQPFVKVVHKGDYMSAGPIH